MIFGSGYIRGKAISRIYNKGELVYESKLNPLRVASVQNRVSTNGLETNASRTNFVFRWPHIVGQDLDTVVVNLHNWVLQDSSSLDGFNAFTIDEASFESVSGQAHPITWGGQRSVTAAIGATDVNSDPLIASNIAGGVNRGDLVWIKGRGHVTSSGWIVCPDQNARRTSDVSGSQCGWYDPSSTVPSSTDAGGVYSFTGTALTSTNTGLCPILLGSPKVDGPSFFGMGDSIMDYDFDTANGAVGRAFFQRSMVDSDLVSNPYPSLNFAKYGSQTFALSTTTKWIPYLKYARFVVEEYGTNNIGTSGSKTAATVLSEIKENWNIARANGIEKIIRTELLGRTTSTDSWSTVANQTAVNRWGPGQISEQVNGLLAVELLAGNINSLISNDGVLDPATPTKWKANGSPNFMTTDGLHPSPDAHAIQGDALRQGIEIMLENI